MQCVWDYLSFFFSFYDCIVYWHSIRIYHKNFWHNFVIFQHPTAAKLIAREIYGEVHHPCLLAVLQCQQDHWWGVKDLWLWEETLECWIWVHLGSVIHLPLFSLQEWACLGEINKIWIIFEVITVTDWFYLLSIWWVYLKPYEWNGSSECISWVYFKPCE